MADATQTIRTPTRFGGFGRERFFGIASASAGAGVIGIFALFGSVDGVWQFTRQVVGTLYMLAVVVAS